ncbi:hypothetical protein FF125_18360 [Aureibaculum algae]|uniref:Uncharacterized protein n=1 Tax=Aureibaculum algae TaxID=2584122 RepID=A0A5B7TY56_9FLAO|nr:hypothetical protein [Aureibaculum algae]QCX40313.1 hypothetical protein FF125_18360 [Aureibaculum algae]
MTEEEHLKYCLKEIEKKLDWKDSSTWKESDYQKLSILISEASTISISPHTLKRLFGKIKYRKHYNPQQATKDALSLFLDYSNWDDFVLKNTSLNSKKNKTQKNDQKKTKKIIWFFIPIIVLIISFIAINQTKSIQKNNDVFTFNLNDSIGIVPYTASLNYDFTQLESDSIFIDFSFEHPTLGHQIIKPEKSRTISNFTYQVPGYYPVLLQKNKKTLAIKKVLALSKSWDSYIVYESELSRFWLDNKIPKMEENGRLYYPQVYLKANGFDLNKVFYTTHRLFKQFEIDGDNFELKTRFKNSSELGGITCFDFILRLFCENNTNHIKLMESGCSQFSGIKFGEAVLSGEQQNLDTFKINLDDWNMLHIVAKNKTVQVFLNNSLIYQDQYQQPNGKIVGIETLFKGTGILDYIQITDLNTNKEFIDAF